MRQSLRLADAVRRSSAGEKCRFVLAPGRINVLGEHTDTSQGWCLPAAVDRALLCAFAPAKDTTTRAVSLDLPGTVQVASGAELTSGSPAFGRYVVAVIEALRGRDIDPPPLSLAFGSTIPAGGGMSSSAALCIALTLALTTEAGAELSPLEVALVAQAAEHRVGVHCGLMDQYAIAHGKKRHALLLDTRAQTHQDVPFDLDDMVLVVGDTKKSRGLVDSEYNARRAQVEEAARILDEGRGKVASLRDVDVELLQAQRQRLGPLLFRRARHVVEENARTLEAASLLEGSADSAGPRELPRRLGQLLDASHASLRDQFEVSCTELDALVSALRELGDHLVPGARMMGGGFGGCVIALVGKASLSQVLEQATEAYRTRTGRDAAFFPVTIESGARLVEPDSLPS